MKFLIIFFLSISSFAQDKPKAIQYSDSSYLRKKTIQYEDSSHVQPENIKYKEIEINDIGVIRSLTACIVDGKKTWAKTIYKLTQDDTVYVHSLFPSIYLCSITYKDIDGFIDENKLISNKLNEYYDNIEQEKELKKVVKEKERIKLMTKKYGKKWGKIVANKEIMVGMTKAMVIDSWGKPDDINRSVGSWGVYEQWVYGDGQYLYFENGKLTSWQD